MPQTLIHLGWNGGEKAMGKARVSDQVSARRLRVAKYPGSSVLITGTVGTGKSSVASCLAEAACKAGVSCEGDRTPKHQQVFGHPWH